MTPAAALCVAVLLAGPADFTYQPPGVLQAGNTGNPEQTVLVPGMRFPIEEAPAYPNSQVYGNGGSQGPGGGQCDAANFSYPWWDNYCEPRSWSMPLCPSGKGHQGQDIRASSCANDAHWAVAAESGTITKIGSYSVYLLTPDGVQHRYLHMAPSSLQVAVGQWVNRGERLGRVSNTFYDSSGNPVPTTVHLHYDIKMYVASVGASVYVSPYMSLVKSYEELLGQEAIPCATVPPEGAVLDDAGPCFTKWGNPNFWRTESGGQGGGLLWTNGWTSASPANWARWSLDLEAPGLYHVEANVVSPWNVAQGVPYRVLHAGEEAVVLLDQDQAAGWLHLGTWWFEAGGGQHVDVLDNTGTTLDDQHMTVDAIRLVPAQVADPPDDPPDEEPDDPVLPPAQPAAENLVLPGEVFTELGWKATETAYLPGVVHAESGWVPVSWFDDGTAARRQEALGAQAIAARTYLLRHLQGGGMSALVPIGPHFQAWAGDFAAHSVSAASATAAVVMTWNGWTITGNYASGAWPVDDQGWPLAPATYGLDEYGAAPALSWGQVLDRYLNGQLGDKGDGYSWTWVLVTDNEGLSGDAVAQTPQSNPGVRNRGSLGQYRSLWLAHQDQRSAADILRAWYGEDVTIHGWAAAEPPVALPPDEPPAATDVPAGLAPDQGLVSSTPVTLTWSPLADAQGYEVEVQWLLAGGWVWYWTWVTGGTSKSFWPTVDPATFRWRVRAQQSAGALGPWSEWAGFDYSSAAAPVDPAGPPPAPADLQPDGGPWSETSVPLTWSPVDGATGYEVRMEYWKDGDSGSWADYHTWEVEAAEWTVWPQVDPATYRWSVRAETAAGWTAWSSWALLEFDTAGAGAPTGLSPAGGVTVSTEDVTLSWSAVPGAGGYEVEIEWKDGGAWAEYYTYETPAGSTSKTFWPAQDAAWYRWRVRASTGDPAPWSPWAEFWFDA